MQWLHGVQTQASREGDHITAFSVPPHPGSSAEAVSRRMSAARRRDTKPEVLLRRELHKRGRRFRVVIRVPGNNRRTVDIAFTRHKLAVFVDGCFWHGCPVHGTRPAANREWWAEKLKANRSRDSDTDGLLEVAGWTVLRIWEHIDAEEAADLVEATLVRLKTSGRSGTEAGGRIEGAGQ